ncbi:hypothetical protein MLD38_009626 [Melastoma candidum]|uniref:Uncharacterized protein n=1 Tax=Melastoma candidum TaxID=119954 RepID=A0ACB9RYB6_9MYRT|nr:hypothetical protein MLD38_009626 [Melastoma candidum]
MHSAVDIDPVPTVAARLGHLARNYETAAKMSVPPTCFRCSWPGCRPVFLPCNDSNSNPKPRKGTRVFGGLGVFPCKNYGSSAGRGAGKIVSSTNRDGQPESSDLDEDKLSGLKMGLNWGFGLCGTIADCYEDRDYLLKLGAGSVAGAALIKYGSAAFPEITKPNLIEALFLISAPVVVVVLLLIKLGKREQ